MLAMLAGPSVSAVLMTALVYGRAGFRDLGARLRTWRAPLRWYGVALLTAPVLMIAMLLALSLASRAFLPGILVAEDTATILLAGLAVGVSAGFVEELGWTGFAVPSLLARHHVIATGVLVGVPWGAWHSPPNFWSSDAAAADLPLVLYAASSIAGAIVGYLPAFRILTVRVYERTGSLLIAMLMHASFTASLLYSQSARPGRRAAGGLFVRAGGGDLARRRGSRCRAAP